MHIISKPTLILGCGISASGKTALLSKLLPEIHDTFWINKDVINEAFMKDRDGRIIPGGITSHYYHRSVRNQSYQVMLDFAFINVNIGKHPVVEGNYNRQIQDGYVRNVIFKMFAETGCDIKLIYCYAPEEVIRARMIERNAQRNDHVLKDDQVWKDFIKEQPIIPFELDQFDHVKINTDQAIDICVSEAIEYLIG